MQVCCLEYAWANAWSLWLQGPARSYSILHYCSEGWASGYSASWAIHLWWVGICKYDIFTCFITACITNDVIVRILACIIIWPWWLLLLNFYLNIVKLYVFFFYQHVYATFLKFLILPYSIIFHLQTLHFSICFLNLCSELPSAFLDYYLIELQLWFIIIRICFVFPPSVDRLLLWF